jgi:serine/threonine protein phosphatase PrpC
MPGGWIAGGASVRGPAHRRREAPNQDAILWRPQDGAGALLVAAVADGHGAAAHFRSGTGARLAVEAALAVLGRMDEAASPAVEIHAAWKRAVLAHADATPTEDWPAGDWIESDDDRLLPYGTTLIAVAAHGARAVALQIGDGDLYFGYPDGRIERPLPDDAGLVGEQTYSLCAPDAAARFRVAMLPGPAAGALPDFALLATDGVAKSFADDAAFHAVVQHYRQAMRGGEPASVFAQLPGWLETVTQRGSGDDATLCLAARIEP